MMDESIFQMLEENGNFEIDCCESDLNFADTEHFSKLELDSTQKMQIGSLMQQIPLAMAAGTVAQAYTIKFPKGLPHTLTALKQGGFGSMISENGRFVGTASFYPMSMQAAIIGVFTSMSIASGQYFLSQINSEMKVMKMKLDDILEFLYGDKRAELIAEMAFVRNVYENYSAIMSHEQHRIATITSLQGAKKVAMKDVEFYMYDLESTVSRKSKDYTELNLKTDKAFQIRESLELSKQLYIMSSMLEVYFAQNQIADYLNSVERDMISYMDKCDKRVLMNFSTLKAHIDTYKIKPMEKVDKSSNEKRIGALIDSLNDGEETKTKKLIRYALKAFRKTNEYYLNRDGNIYMRA